MKQSLLKHKNYDVPNSKPFKRHFYHLLSQQPCHYNNNNNSTEQHYKTHNKDYLKC